MKRAQAKAATALLFFLAATLAGCQSVSTYYQGHIVAPEDVLPLQDSSTDREWSTFDMTITYSTRQTGEYFNINGQATLSDHYTMNYSYLERLEIYLVLLDQDSTVIETRRLANSQTYRLEYPVSFSVQLPLAASVSAFSFAYDGTVRESGKLKDGTVPFWHLPREK